MLGINFSEVSNIKVYSKGDEVVTLPQFNYEGLKPFAYGGLASNGIFVDNKNNFIKIIQKENLAIRGRSCPFSKKQYFALFNHINSNNDLSDILIKYIEYGTFIYKEFGVSEEYLYIVSEVGEPFKIKEITNSDLIKIAEKIDKLNKQRYTHGDIKLGNIIRRKDGEIVFIDYEDTIQFTGCRNREPALCREIDGKTYCPEGRYIDKDKSSTLNLDKQSFLLIIIFREIIKENPKLATTEEHITDVMYLSEAIAKKKNPNYEKLTNILSDKKQQFLETYTDENFLENITKYLSKGWKFSFTSSFSRLFSRGGSIKSKKKRKNKKSVKRKSKRSKKDKE